MAEHKSEFLNELEGGRADFTDEEFARLKEYVERRDRATAPATAAPMENAPAPSTSIGMFMPSTVPELRGRENLGTFLKRFRTWACVSRCDSALDSEIVVKTSGTPLAELERLHEHSLVENSLKAWQALTKALEKEKEIMKMVIDIGPLPEAWRALTKIATETEVVAYDRAKREFESLQIGVWESVVEYFARVHVILMKLARHQVTTPAREIKRTVLGSLSSRFPDEVRLYAMKGEALDLKDLENGLTWAESFQSDQERRDASAHALAVGHSGSGRTGAESGARGQGRHGKRSANLHDDGRGRNQQQGSFAIDALWAATPAAPMAATPAVAESAVTLGGASAAPAIQPLGHLGETTSPTAVPERSASPAKTTTSGRRSVALAPAAHV